MFVSLSLATVSEFNNSLNWLQTPVCLGPYLVSIGESPQRGRQPSPNSRLVSAHDTGVPSKDHAESFFVLKDLYTTSYMQDDDPRCC